MKKEVFLAITIGFVLGLIITFGIWTANKSLKGLSSQKQIAQSPTPSPKTVTPTTQPLANALPLSITTPDDESVTNTPKTTLSGMTLPNSVVAMTFEGGEQILESDSTGNFSIDIDLEGGYNHIQVTVFDKTGNSTSQTLIVTYTTAKI